MSSFAAYRKYVTFSALGGAEKVKTTSDGVAAFTGTGSAITANMIVTAAVAGIEGQTFSTTINGKTLDSEDERLALVPAVYEEGTPD